MAVKTYVKPILPKIYPQHVQVIRRNLRNATKRVCDHGAAELRLFVGSWNHKPDPKVDVKDKGNDIVGSVIVEDTAMFMLDKGTSHRWAVMTKGFQAKTSVGSLRSKAGVGHARLRGRGQMIRAGYYRPMKGITAREISDTLAKLLIPEFNYEIDKVMFDAIQKGQAKP